MSFSSSRFFVPGGGAPEEDANDEADGKADDEADEEADGKADDEADEEADDEADDEADVEADGEADDEADGGADDEASVVCRVGGAMENRRGFDVEARAKSGREVDVSEVVTSLPLEDVGGRLNRDIRGRSDAGLQTMSNPIDRT
jgi:hypothetical protein